MILASFLPFPHLVSEVRIAPKEYLVSLGHFGEPALSAFLKKIFYPLLLPTLA